MGGVTSPRKRRAEYIVRRADRARVSVMRGRDGRTEINARITVYDIFMRLYYIYVYDILYECYIVLVDLYNVLSRACMCIFVAEKHEICENF